MASKELETFAQFERYYSAGGIRTRCFEKGEGSPNPFARRRRARGNLGA